MSLSFLLRLAIAVAAFGIAGARLWWPDMKVDLTLLALVAVALIALFGRGIRIKTLDLLGFKVEFDQVPPSKPAPTPSEANVQSAHVLPLSPTVYDDNYLVR